MTGETILQVKDLKTYFRVDEGIVKAVDGVSFDLGKGQTLGIVGESGSGKSVANLSILNLISDPPGRIVGGEILYRGDDLLKLSPSEIRRIRGNKISMIFQDPMTSLNPFLRISVQMTETLILHRGLSRTAAREKAIGMLALAGIPAAAKRIDDYPHQFSGGMRQRVMIAMSLSCDPDILIADEPTSALDVTIQAQILDLIRDLTSRLGTAVILITHSLGVVAGTCDTICVMYAGRIVERGPVDGIFSRPGHPYTQGLIKAIPRLDGSAGKRLFSIKGQAPNLIGMAEGCPFQPRCDKSMDICTRSYPPPFLLDNGCTASCWLYDREALP